VQQAGILRDSVGPRVQVKAAGRFRRLADVRAAVNAGATRVSAELSPELAQAVAAAFEDEPADRAVSTRAS
jgi:deoxyribose-phosphate aldolase